MRSGKSNNKREAFKYNIKMSQFLMKNVNAFKFIEIFMIILSLVASMLPLTIVGEFNKNTLRDIAAKEEFKIFVLVLVIFISLIIIEPLLFQKSKKSSKKENILKRQIISTYIKSLNQTKANPVKVGEYE